LAEAVSASRRDVAEMVLWEPVLDGVGYVRQLRALHENWLEREAGTPRDARAHSINAEVYGHPFNERLEDSLRKLGMPQCASKPADSILVVTQDENESIIELVNHYRGLTANVDFRQVSESFVWEQDVGIEQTPVPLPVLELIGLWLREAGR
jgi:hypothetical protein